MDVATSFARTVLNFSGRAAYLTAYVVAGFVCVGLVCVGPSAFRFFVLRPYKSYVKYLPGPKSKGAFVTDCDLILEATTCKEINERFAREYGLNLRIQGFGYMDQRLVTYDPVTISYILGPATDRFLKPVQMRRIIARLTGGDMNLKGINVVEGPYHHRIRKMIIPAFAPSTVRGHAPVFIRTASELCDAWRSVLANPTGPIAPGVEADPDPKGNILLDVHNWAGRFAFDIIGLAAFGYPFNSIRDDTNPVFGAYMQLHNGARVGQGWRASVYLTWPQFERFLRDKSTDVIVGSAQIVRETSKMVLKEMYHANPEGDGKSILGLLLRGNSKAAPEDRLTDEELLTQIDSFMFAGSDTTGLATTWALYELARNSKVQEALRAELLPLGLNEHAGEQVAVDYAAQFVAIDALPLLDRVVRESLRLNPSVPTTLRVAEEDDIVPFSLPPKMSDGSISPAVVTGLGADGVKRTGIRIRKGDFVHIPFEPMNAIRDMWGEDGHKFKWLNLPAAAKSNPGVVAGLSTFSVGPHSCPAFQFAMAEMKVAIAYLVSSFILEETYTILPRCVMMNRPLVKGQRGKGFRLPLRVRAL